MSHVQLLTNLARVEADHSAHSRRPQRRRRSRRLQVTVSRLTRGPVPVRAAHA
jgi:hypothetical protein